MTSLSDHYRSQLRSFDGEAGSCFNYSGNQNNCHPLSVSETHLGLRDVDKTLISLSESVDVQELLLNTVNPRKCSVPLHPSPRLTFVKGDSNVQESEVSQGVFTLHFNVPIYKTIKRLIFLISKTD